LLAVIAAMKPRNQAESAKPFHQIRKPAAIFLIHGCKLQPQSTTGFHMPHHRFGPDLSFFDKKM